MAAAVWVKPLLSANSQKIKKPFFTGVETNEKQNLDNLSRCIMEYTTGIAENTSFPSFQAAFEHVFELAGTRRIILVIDEYPYVARASKSLASTLQLLIDKNRDTSRLFLILCGSSMSYMEDLLLFPAEPPLWPTDALPLSSPPTWAVCLRKSADSIYGSCSSRADVR